MVQSKVISYSDLKGIVKCLLMQWHIAKFDSDVRGSYAFSY